MSGYHIVRTVYNVIGAGPFLVARADPSRVYLLFASMSGGSVVLCTDTDFRTDGASGAPKALHVTIGDHVKFKLADDGPMVQSEWYAWDATGVPQAPGLTEISVWEVTKIRPGECV